MHDMDNSILMVQESWSSTEVCGYRVESMSFEVEKSVVAGA